MIIHTVQSGDTISSIASQYGVSSEKIESDNSLTPNYNLNIGQAIMIAPPESTYLVKEQDTIESISDANAIRPLQLIRDNPQLLQYEAKLTPGEELVLSYSRKKSIQVLGYASSFITEQTLRKALPYLTYLTCLNYRVFSTGTITEINDDRILQLASEYDVIPIMFVSAMSQPGVGSYATTHAILSNVDIQLQLIENILILLKNKGFRGVDLAFYSILQEDLPAYITFVTTVTGRLNREGYEVFVTLTPQTMGYQPGSGLDNPYYAALGNAANKVILITYLWQSASLSQVSQTMYSFLKSLLEYVTTQIPPEKIFITINTVAYDWELPYIESEPIGTSLTSSGALTLANQLGAVIEFDDLAQIPYFYYNTFGIDHFVWFEDARAFQAILRLVDEYDLAGIAIWNILYYYPQLWLLINSQYNITTYFIDNNEG